MFNKRVVQQAIINTWERINPHGMPPDNPANGQDKEVSMLIHDVFGGEILKTPVNNGWHFYNRINGQRLDFSNTSFGRFDEVELEDLPSTPKETNQYFDEADYIIFFNKFIIEFENIVGLKRQQPEIRQKFYSTA